MSTKLIFSLFKLCVKWICTFVRMYESRSLYFYLMRVRRTICHLLFVMVITRIWGRRRRRSREDRSQPASMTWSHLFHEDRGTEIIEVRVDCSFSFATIMDAWAFVFHNIQSTGIFVCFVLRGLFAAQRHSRSPSSSSHYNVVYINKPQIIIIMIVIRQDVSLLG